MKLLSKCKPVGSTLVVAAPLELLTGITCNSCSVASSTIGGIAEIEIPDSVTCCGIFCENPNFQRLVTFNLAFLTSRYPFFWFNVLSVRYGYNPVTLKF
ncbi:hypothetical protein Hanom_Chr04g00338861 [Helianthus anomalus]